MFKLVVLSVLLAVAAASGIHGVAPLAYSQYAVPSAVSYQTRTDVVSKPVVATYAAAAPVVAAYSAPAVAAYSAPVVASYAAPAVAVPSAVSYQSRTDVVSKPVVATYAAAAPVAYHAPLAYQAPVAYAAPVVKSVAQGATITSYTSPGVVESVAHGSPVVAAYSAPQYW